MLIPPKLERMSSSSTGKLIQKIATMFLGKTALSQTLKAEHFFELHLNKTPTRQGIRDDTKVWPLLEPRQSTLKSMFPMPISMPCKSITSDSRW